MALAASLIAHSGFEITEGEDAQFTLRISGYSGSYSYSYGFSTAGGTAIPSDFSGGAGSGMSSFSSTALYHSDTEISFSAFPDGDPSDADVNLFLNVNLNGALFDDGSRQKSFEITILNDPTPVISTVAGDDVITSDEKDEGVSVTGKSESNANVTVNFGSGEQSTIANENGDWQVLFATEEIPEDGPAQIRVAAEGSASATAYHDVVVQTMVVLSGTVADRAGESVGSVLISFTPEASGEHSDESLQSVSDGAFSFELGYGAIGELNAARDYDASTDPTIDASDALEVLRLAVGLAPSWGAATDEHFIAADITRDEQVTAQDALEVLRHAVGLVSDHTPEWVFIKSDAELAGISREAVTYQGGVDVPEMLGHTDLSLTAILLGNMES